MHWDGSERLCGKSSDESQHSMLGATPRTGRITKAYTPTTTTTTTTTATTTGVRRRASKHIEGGLVMGLSSVVCDNT